VRPPSRRRGVDRDGRDEHHPELDDEKELDDDDDDDTPSF
jgi:hypothetical protein